MKNVDSDVARESVLRTWDEVLQTRLNDPKTGMFIVIDQSGSIRADSYPNVRDDPDQREHCGRGCSGRQRISQDHRRMGASRGKIRKRRSASDDDPQRQQQSRRADAGQVRGREFFGKAYRRPRRRGACDARDCILTASHGVAAIVHRSLAVMCAGRPENLKVAWTMQLGGVEGGGIWTHGGLEGTPIVENGMMYVTDGWGSVYKIVEVALL
jgi:hypothetical protein